MILQAFKMSIKSIMSNKMRSLLTMLGVIIGVVALVVLVSLVSGATDSITNEVSSMGSNLLQVTIRDDKANPLRLEDMDMFLESEDIAAVAPMASLSLTAVYGQNEEMASITGTTSSYRDIQNVTLLYGRFIKSTDVANNTNVCVINYEGAEALFDRTDVIGESFTLGGRSFLIVGVTEKSASMMTSFFSGSVSCYIPYTTAVRMTSSGSYIHTFFASGTSHETMDMAEASMTEMLMDRFRNDDQAFRIFNISSMMDTMGNITGTMSVLLGGIAAISLLVGGIGIMNIMLVSVTERTKEIGIRKAIGASRRSILMQFLIEAMVLSLLGCLIGIIISWIIVALVELFSSDMLHFALSPGVVAVSVIFSVGIGVLFGLYPANKAAKKNPIEALRYAG